jgi:hypothetical protein
LVFRLIIIVSIELDGDRPVLFGILGQPMIIDDDIKQIDLFWLLINPDVGPALSASGLDPEYYRAAITDRVDMVPPDNADL